MKIVVLGPNGQVGWELRRALAPLGELIVLPRTALGGFCGDLEHPTAVAETLRRLRPNVIVNAAAYTAVDRAESEPERAYAVNATGPGFLGVEAAVLGALLIHYSTDYVFAGDSDRPWREDDPTGPLSVYGQTKLAGEQKIRDSGCHYIILRCSWVYAARGGNFLRTMLRLAAEREALRIVDDQWGAPTGAELIADVTAHVLRQAAGRADQHAGTYHLAAAGFTQWCDYAQLIIAHARDLGWPVKVGTNGVTGISTKEYPTPARRPRYSVLDCSRLEQQFDLQLPDWRIGVERTLTEILSPRA